MLSARLRETDPTREVLRARADAQAARVASAAAGLTDLALAAVASDVDDAYAAQKAIETELRRTQALLKSHAHHAALYSGVLDTVATQLKELGDVANWAQTLEALAADVADVAATVGTVSSGSASQEEQPARISQPERDANDSE